MPAHALEISSAIAWRNPNRFLSLMDVQGSYDTSRGPSKREMLAQMSRSIVVGRRVRSLETVLHGLGGQVDRELRVPRTMAHLDAREPLQGNPQRIDAARQDLRGRDFLGRQVHTNRFDEGFRDLHVCVTPCSWKPAQSASQNAAN